MVHSLYLQINQNLLNFLLYSVMLYVLPASFAKEEYINIKEEQKTQKDVVLFPELFSLFLSQFQLIHWQQILQ